MRSIVPVKNVTRASRTRSQSSNMNARSPTRRKVRDDVAADVRFAVDSRCCLCEVVIALPPRTQHGQLHHLDENPANNDPDNLVWLCLNHHEEAGKVGKTTRRLSPQMIRKYRALVQKKVARGRAEPPRRSHARSVFAEVLDALVVLDVRKLGIESEWDGRDEALIGVLGQLTRYPDTIGFEARREILDYLSNLASGTRHRLSPLVASMIRRITIDLLRLHYLYASRTHRITSDDLALFEYGIEIGADMAYDGALYLRNLKVVDEGCEILWRLLSYSTIHRHTKLCAAILAGFEIAQDGATRSGSSVAVALVRAARLYGEAGGKRHPDYPSTVIDEL